MSEEKGRYKMSEGEKLEQTMRKHIKSFGMPIRTQPVPEISGEQYMAIIMDLYDRIEILEKEAQQSRSATRPNEFIGKDQHEKAGDDIRFSSAWYPREIEDE